MTNDVTALDLLPADPAMLADLDGVGLMFCAWTGECDWTCVVTCWWTD